MRKQKIKEDIEQQKILSDGQKIIELTKSDGWQIAKRKLLSKIAILDSITALPQGDREDKLREIEVRAGVVSIIWEWINDVEGMAEQAKQVSKAMQDVREESFITVYDNTN
jgi:hypothetical protein